MIVTERRDSASFLQFLEQMIARFPAERWVVIEDNLSTLTSRDVKLALLSWLEIQFLPKYASWTNLVEPWRKQRKSLTRKGRRFETTDEIERAIDLALAHWNDHRRPYQWRKVPAVLPTPPLGEYGSTLIPCAI